MIEMVAMVMDNSIIAVEGQMPLILETHLENFRKLIKGKIVVMGTHTYESLGESPFVSARETVVMSRHKNYGRKVRMIRNTLELIETHKDFIVIGGATLFSDIMPIADRIYLTEVSEKAEPGNKIKLFPSLRHMVLDNPGAEFQHEGDHYFRFLEYRR